MTAHTPPIPSRFNTFLDANDAVGPRERHNNTKRNLQ